jgi:hypothetical protein
MLDKLNINWISLAEYLQPLLLHLGKYGGIEIKDNSAELKFKQCILLLFYDRRDRYISAYIIDLTGIRDNNHMVQLTPTFGYYLNGSFKEYVETLNKSDYKFFYTDERYMIFDYWLSILNSSGLKDFLNKGTRVNEYIHWLKENAQVVNQELMKVYSENSGRNNC